MPFRWAVLVDDEVHVTDDLLEPRSRNSRSRNLERANITQIAARIKPSQRRNFPEGESAERHIPSLVYLLDIVSSARIANMKGLAGYR